MQFSHALVLAFVASVAAQATGTIDGDVAALPACAKTCLDKATLAAGCKSITDYECQCGTAYAKINAEAAPCVASTCNSSDLTKTLALTTEICKLVKAGGSSSGSSSSGSESSSAAPSSTEKSDTAAPSGTGSSTGSSAPTTTGSGTASSTGSEGTASSTGESASSTTAGGAASSSSKAAAATGSWNFAAVAAGAGVVAAGLL